MQPLRVAALMDTSIVSGPGRQLVAVARELQDRQVELRIITFQRRGRPASPFPDFARSRGIACDVVEETSRLDVSVLHRVSELVRAQGAQVLQSHSYKPAAVAAVLSRRLHLPWVGMFHGTTLEDRRVRLYNWIDQRLLRLADRIVVVSPSQQSLFSHSARLRLIPNAVLQPDAPAIADPAYTSTARPRIAVIGRLSHEKGVDQFLDAMAVLRVRGFVGSALVIGDGPDRAALEARAKAHDLSGYVVFLGQRADVGDLYPHLDLVVIPSRSEGMPNVLLEAIRADCPVVATAVGAIPTIIGSTAAALIVPPGNPVLLAEAILRGLAELRSADASEARAAIAAEYSLDRRAQLFRSLYDEVLHHHHGLRREVLPDVMADA